MFDSFEDFHPLDFFKLAQELSIVGDNLNSSDSAIMRNIYGRIYYAIFLWVREELSNNTDYISYGYGEHSRMPKYIKNKGPFDNSLNRKISKDLIALKKLRQQSDYYIKIPSKFSSEYADWIFEDVDYAFAIANNIINAFNSLN